MELIWQDGARQMKEMGGGRHCLSQQGVVVYKGPQKDKQIMPEKNKGVTNQSLCETLASVPRFFLSFFVVYMYTCIGF